MTGAVVRNRDQEARMKMQETVFTDESLDHLFVHPSCNVDEEMTFYGKMGQINQEFFSGS